jgi:hypothetical protein
MGKHRLCAARLYQGDLNIEGCYFPDQRFDEAVKFPFAGVIDAGDRKTNLTADARDLENASPPCARKCGNAVRNLDRARCSPVLIPLLWSTVVRESWASRYGNPAWLAKSLSPVFVDTRGSGLSGRPADDTHMGSIDVALHSNPNCGLDGGVEVLIQSAAGLECSVTHKNIPSSVSPCQADRCFIVPLS